MAKHIIKSSDVVDAEELTDESSYGIAKTAVLYAVASLILAMLLAPLSSVSVEKLVAVVAGGDQTITGGVDNTVTGSVESAGKKRTRMRRSVLQSDPREPCYLLENGRTEGNC